MNERCPDSVSDERASLIVAHDEGNAFDAVVPPIVQTSLFTFGSVDEMAATYRGERHALRPIRATTTRPCACSRRRWPSSRASRMPSASPAAWRAISAAVLGFVAPGDRIVCVQARLPRCLPPVRDAAEALRRRRRPMSTASTTMRSRRPCPVRELFYMESPTSWTMETHDVAALAALARRHDVAHHDRQQLGDAGLPAAAVARRRSRPPLGLEIYRRPQRRGGGRGRRPGGTDRHDPRGRSAPISAASSSPFDAWLLLRGLRTLPDPHEGA